MPLGRPTAPTPMRTPLGNGHPTITSTAPPVRLRDYDGRSVCAGLGAVIDKLADGVAKVIDAAAGGPLALIALAVIALALIAYFFFKSATEKIRVAIFLGLFVGAAAFIVALFQLASRPASGPATNTAAAPGAVGPYVAWKTPGPATAPSAPAVATVRLCDNTNTLSVDNGPPSRTSPCVLRQGAHITQLVTYHWNHGRGATPGTIMFLNPMTGEQHGPFAATGSAGQAGAANVNWTANVNLVVPAGGWQVIDSDADTWSWNDESGNHGFVVVFGDWLDALPSRSP